MSEPTPTRNTRSASARRGVTPYSRLPGIHHRPMKGLTMMRTRSAPLSSALESIPASVERTKSWEMQEPPVGLASLSEDPLAGVALGSQSLNGYLEDLTLQAVTAGSSDLVGLGAISDPIPNLAPPPSQSASREREPTAENSVEVPTGSPASGAACFTTRTLGAAICMAAIDNLQVGKCSDLGGCLSMEDELVVYRGPDYAFFGVYDGHGGSEAARFCQQQLHLNVKASEHFSEEGDAASRLALRDGFAKTEQALMTMQTQQSHGGHAASCPGTTALTLLLRRGGRSINLAWAGDSRAVLCRAGSAYTLTADHRVTSDRERARVLREGGEIQADRLCGYLAVSRALGDMDQETRRKPPGLSAQPELRSEPLRPEDEFIILGSDGLWDAVSDTEAIRVARAEFRAYDDSEMVAERLVQLAASRSVDDNVSVLVVRLFPPEDQSDPSPSLSFVKLDTLPCFVRVVGGFS